VEPDHIERNRESEKCAHYLAASPEGDDGEEMYDDHHVQDIGSCLENLDKGKSFVSVVEVAGGWWENPCSTKDRHKKNKTEEDLGDDM
jgi:hypothetical protein